METQAASIRPVDATARLAETAVLKHGTTHVINAFIQRTSTAAANAYLGIEQARDVYGVALSPDLTVDIHATAALRQKMETLT